MRCPRRPEARLRRVSGFAVAWMLVLVALIALAGGAAAQDVLFAQQLAGTRALAQRAMGMAELGLRLGMQQLADPQAPPADTGELRPGTLPSDTVRVQLRAGAPRMPAGSSAGRFIERDYEIHSSGRSARGANRVLVQGVTRLELGTSAP